MVESALETKTNTMTRMRAIDPMIIRAQCAADPIMVAREIVRAKIEAGLKLTMTDGDARRRAAEEWAAKKRRRNHGGRRPCRRCLLALLPKRWFARAKERQSAAFMDALRAAARYGRRRGRMASSVIKPKKRSTKLIQDAEVGVKWEVEAGTPLEPAPSCPREGSRSAGQGRAPQAPWRACRPRPRSSN